MAELSERDVLELRWLSRQTKAMWGGPLERDQPITDPDMIRWEALGLIERVGPPTHPFKGFVVTKKCRELLSQHH